MSSAVRGRVYCFRRGAGGVARDVRALRSVEYLAFLSGVAGGRRRATSRWLPRHAGRPRRPEEERQSVRPRGFMRPWESGSTACGRRGRCACQVPTNDVLRQAGRCRRSRMDRGNDAGPHEAWGWRPALSCPALLPLSVRIARRGLRARQSAAKSAESDRPRESQRFSHSLCRPPPGRRRLTRCVPCAGPLQCRPRAPRGWHRSQLQG